MKRLPLVFLGAMVVSGCLLGGEGDTSTVVENKNTGAISPKIKRILPGLYLGDYTLADTALVPDEFVSELTLKPDSTFQLYWILQNNAVYSLNGKWVQHDSSVHFSEVKKADIVDDYLGLSDPIEDDTDAVLSVTDTSFYRREYTPLRQKPVWVSYARRTETLLTDGDYSVSFPQVAPITGDSLDTTVVFDTLTVKYIISVKGRDFVYREEDDDVEVWRLEAKVEQIGSFLTTDENRYRALIDSNQTFSDWQNITEPILWHVRSVSDSTFQLWDPASSTWQDYRRNP